LLATKPFSRFSPRKTRAETAVFNQPESFGNLIIRRFDYQAIAPSKIRIGNYSIF
jgi:hypothetical protein